MSTIRIDDNLLCWLAGPLIETALKLLIYSHAFAPQVGGVETFSAYLARGLSQRAAESNADPLTVVVVTQTPNAANAVFAAEPFDVVRRPKPFRLWRLVGAADRVVLAGPAILPLIFALIHRKPVIVTHHGYQTICPNGMLLHLPTLQTCPGHFSAGHYLECFKCNLQETNSVRSARLVLLTFVRRALSRVADFNVAVSEHVARRMALPHSRVVSNGIPGRAALENNRMTPLCFAYVGRLVAEKGVRVLIEAAGILKQRQVPFQIFIIGDGPERAALQRQVSSLQLDAEIQFLGFRLGPQLEELLRRISVVIVPSIWEEPAPFSVIEQMMQGKLIIASDLGGLPEQIGSSGLIFPAGDALALAENMGRIIEQPGLVSGFGEKARERAQHFYTLERMLSGYRSLLDQL